MDSSNDNSKDKKSDSAGRARGHSLWSMLKIKPYFQAKDSKPHQAADATSKSASDAPLQRPDVGGSRGRVVSEGRMHDGLPVGVGGTAPQFTRSALTTAMQQDRKYSKKASFRTTTNETIDEEPIARSKPIAIKKSDTLTKVKLSAEASRNDGDAQIRAGCDGLPHKKSFLGAEGNTPPRFRMSRRSTLADKPELDTLLRATMVTYNKHKYLPLTATTLYRLSPYWKGAKPIADMSIFNCLVLNHELNNVHADHVVAAMERIGHHVSHLLVVPPVHTTELGNVFNREIDNVGSGNDWDHILECFPHLKWLMLVHPVDTSGGSPCDTYTALVTAVAKRQSAQKDVDRFRFECGPLALLGN